MVLNKQKFGKQKEEDEIAEGLDEDDLDEDDFELLEEKKAKKPFPPRAVKPQAPQARERFVVFSTPARFGIMDRETQEVLGEGDATTLQVLANILERLERIEANIGSMIGE